MTGVSRVVPMVCVCVSRGRGKVYIREGPYMCLSWLHPFTGRGRFWL